MTKDPNDNPIISQPSLFRPSVEVLGNRETRPSTSQWVRLFSLPTNPVDAMAASLQWLWASYSTLGLALITPVAIQVALGVAWVFILSGLFILTLKDATAKVDAYWVLTNVAMGILLFLA